MSASSVLAALALATAGTQTVTGTVAYRDRSALPAGAAVTVVLEDVSRADAPAPVVASWTARAAGSQVPLGFTLSYFDRAVAGATRLNIRATINLDDRVLYRTTRAYEVVTNGVRRIEIVVDRETPRQVQNTDWVLVRVGDQSVPGESATLRLDSRTSQIRGNGGVNSFGGTYSISGGKVKFSLGAMTLMAGPSELMAVESAFMDALRRADAYRQDGDRLTLFEGDQALAVFEAKTPGE
jgi:putative lipoprotein